MNVYFLQEKTYKSAQMLWDREIGHLVHIRLRKRFSELLHHLQWSLFFAMWSSFATLAPAVLWLCSPESTQPGLIRFCWNQFRLRVSSRENLRWRFKKLAFIIICQTSEDFMAFFYKENITSFQLWRQDRVPNSDLKFKINKAGSFQMIIDYIFVLLADLAQILIKNKRLTPVNPKHFSQTGSPTWALSSPPLYELKQNSIATP